MTCGGRCPDGVTSRGKGATRGDLEEMALIPGKDKRPAWSYPNTFNTTADSGFWQAMSRTIFYKRAETGMAKAALKGGCLPSLRASAENRVDDEPMNHIRAKEMKPAYPAGKPLKPDELRSLGPRAPVGNGVRIFWGPAARSGCSNGAMCSYNQSMIGLENMRWLVKAQLARRRGRKGRIVFPLKRWMDTQLLWGMPIQPLHWATMNTVMDIDNRRGSL